MLAIQKLVSQIREALAVGGHGMPVEDLASEYTRLAQEANQRLESCAGMLANGSEYQALQLAETEPVLLDLIAGLSFAEAPDWLRLCAAQRLPIPPRFDGKAIQALDRLYAKGIESTHPLYKDYRAAVTSRNEARALQIIRSIVQLNPDDANARSELDRWERKVFQSKLQDLRTALESGREEPILHGLAELERLATPESLAGLPEFVRAQEIRRAEARRASSALAARLVSSLAEEREAGGWRMIGDHLARISQLQSAHGFQLSPEQAAICVGMQRYFEEQRAAAAENVRYQEALREVDGLTHQLETRMLTRSTLKLSESEHLYLEFNRRWKEVEQFQKAVPEDLTHRVRTMALALRAEVDRLQKNRRTILVASIAAALVAITIAQWFAVRAYRVYDASKQLAALQAEGQVDAAEKMVARLRIDSPGLAARPALQARIDAIERWTQEQRARFADTDARLKQLEKAGGDGFAESDFTTLADDFSLANQLVESLPAGLRATVADRAAVLKNKFEIYLAGIREKITAETEQELAALETIAGSRLGYGQSQTVVAAALEEGSPRLQALDARMHPKLAALELPAAQQARWSALKKRFDQFVAELVTLEKCHEATVQARNLTEYQRALEGFRASQLIEDSEVKAARLFLIRFPRESDVLASLFLPGDPVAWSAAKADSSGEAFAPKTVLATERYQLLAIRDDNYLSDIWEATVSSATGRPGSHLIYSRGKIEFSNPVGEPQWTGSFYTPGTSSSDVALFLDKATYQSGDGISVILRNIRPSVAWQCLLRLELNRLTDEQGEKYEKSLLGIFDRLVHDKQAPAAVKGYLMQQLAVLLKLRSNDWGLQFCPSLRADLESLGELCRGEKIRGHDWLVDRRREMWNGRLGAFFSELGKREYLEEGRKQRSIVRTALTAGLHYAGFLDGDGRAHLHAEAAPGVLLWAYLSDGGKIARFVPPPEEQKADARFARFTPIFFVPIDRDALLARKSNAPDASGTTMSVAPFFNP